MTFAAISWTAFSSVLFYHLTGALAPTHHTDVAPDYPGGVLGFLWMVTNLAVWGLVFWI